MRPNIVVIGSLNMDLVIQLARSPKIGETVLGDSIHFVPGGKGANQAVAAARLGAEVAMIGSVGTDAFGSQLLASLQAEGIDTSGVRRVAEAPTGIASIVLAQGDNSIIVVPGANSHCSPEDIDRYQARLEHADVVLVQMEIPMTTVAYAVRTAKRLGKTVILNPAPAQPLPPDLLAGVDFLTPNQSELALLSGLDQMDGELDAGMDALLAKGVSHVVTTLGERGVVYRAAGGQTQRFPAYQVPVVDTTGAGDAFNAGLAYALADRRSVKEAIEFASKVAALAVSKLGAQAGMPTLQEVVRFSHGERF